MREARGRHVRLSQEAPRQAQSVHDSEGQLRVNLYRLELLSSLGVLALSLGLGVLMGSLLRPAAWTLLIAGGAAHGAAMLRRHQIERRAGAHVP